MIIGFILVIIFKKTSLSYVIANILTIAICPTITYNKNVYTVKINMPFQQLICTLHGWITMEYGILVNYSLYDLFVCCTFTKQQIIQ